MFDNRGASRFAIGVILNPRARAASDPRLLSRLQAVLGDATLCAAPASPAELPAALQRLCARPIAALAVCGGDGTLSAVATALCDLHGVQPGDPPRFATPPPRLALLRGGTVNTIARNLGVRGQPVALLRRLMDDPHAATDVARSAALVAVSHDGQRRHGFLFAAAMGARFLDTYYQREPGLWRAAALTLRTVASTLIPGGGALARRLFAETEADLTVDRDGAGALPIAQRRFRLLLASTIPDVGMGMRVTWRAQHPPEDGGLTPGRLHLVASRLPISAMAAQLPRLLRGQPLLPHPEHLDWPVREVRLRFPSPQPCTLDGELFHTSEVTVSAGPLLRLCVSARSF